MIIEITAVKLDSPDSRKCWATQCGENASWVVYSKTDKKEIVCQIASCKKCLSSAVMLALQNYTPMGS